MDAFTTHRPALLRLAYQMLGSMADAEDAVQEAWLRWDRAGCPELERPGAWLTRTCTRLCIDRLRETRRERETYVGEWLPELLVEDPPPDRVELDDSISMALLHTLQTLRPAERAAFLLHDVFGHSFPEVAAILDKEPAHCRQLAVRARGRLHHREPSRKVDAEAVEELTAAFFTAIDQGDHEALHAVLTADVVLRTDGGGKVCATRRPIFGADAVARFFHRIFRPAPRPLVQRRIWFNGAPGTVLFDSGQPVSAFQIEVAGNRIAAIYVQRNPDKLRAVMV